MTVAIHIEMLNFIGAKAFLDVLARGQCAFLPASQETLGLAQSMLRKSHPQTGQDSPLCQAMDVEPTLEKKALTLFAKGLAANGEAGVKDAVRLVYESVFVAAGLPVEDLFKTAEVVSPVVAPSPASIPSAQSSALVTEVTNIVLQCVCEQLGVELSDITPEKRLVADLGADSLDLIELTMFIEDEMDIEIQDEQAENISTVKQAIDLAVRLRQEQIENL